MKKRGAWLSGILLVTIGIDQWTKILARDFLLGRPRYSYLGDVFRLEYSENPGAFLSFGAGLSDDARFWIFSVGVGIFVGFTFFYLLTRKTPAPVFWGLSLLVSGGVGNLIDRIARGRVIDFMNLGLGELRTGIFNVADMAIMAGVFLLFWDSWANSRNQSRDAARIERS